MGEPLAEEMVRIRLDMTEKIILTFDKVKDTGLGDPLAEGIVRIRLDYNDEVIEVTICTFANFLPCLHGTKKCTTIISLFYSNWNSGVQRDSEQSCT